MMLVLAMLIGQPIMVGEDATVKARPWVMSWAEVYRTVLLGREQFIVVGSDAKGATRCDDGPQVGGKFTFVEDVTGVTREFTIEAGKVYRCFLSDKGVPSFEPREVARRPVVEAVRAVVTRPIETIQNCLPGGT